MSNPNGQSRQAASSGQSRLDFSDLHNHCGSTYAALSYVFEVIIFAGRPSLQNVTEAEMDQILHLLESHQVDLSSLSQFPLDAPDVDETLLLLARLQNRATMVEQKAAYEPTIQDITEYTLLDRSKKTHRYNIGEWMEVRGPSMRYRMELIHNVLRRKDDDGEVEYFYETAVDHKLTLPEVRWPREALRRIFGMGPWAWQQWATLKLEDKLIFKEGHAHDFEILDIPGYAQELWDLWLNDKRNKEFRALYERVGPSGQDELVHHIMSPFNLIERVIHDEDQWDFEDAGVSIFTYISLLGSGFVDGAIIFFLQVAIPVILFFFYYSERDSDEIASGTREMLFAVLIYYLYKVVRDTASDFHEITGLASSTISRIQSLRKLVWEKGNDSMAQSLGYTCDVWMNTAYICYLYMFNIWILFNVSDPFELLGSVIFFEFLFGLDEEIASSRWWDTRTKRYLKAGVVGTILQNTVRREHCKNSDVFLSKYTALYSDAERERLKKRMGDMGLLGNGNAYTESDHQLCTSVGCFGITFCGCTSACSSWCCCGNRNNNALDTWLQPGSSDVQSQLLTVTERVERIRRRESNSYYRQPAPKRFSGAFCCGGFFSADCPLFERHRDLRGWSKWEELIFLFPTPKLVPAGYQAGTKLLMNASTGAETAIRTKRGYSPGTTRRMRFLRHMWEVLICKYGRDGFRTGAEHETFSFYLTRTLHGFVMWQSCVLQILFPFITVLALVLVYYGDGYCTLHLGECTLPVYFEEDGSAMLGVPAKDTDPF